MLTALLVTTGLLMGTMLLFGWVFLKHPPKDINYVYGYRTSRSTRNINTWRFAHKTAGRIWMKSGIIGTLVSLMIILLFYYFGDLETLFYFLYIPQLFLLLMVIPLTERELKRTFDDDGSRIDERKH